MAIAVENTSAINCLEFRQSSPSPRLAGFVRAYEYSDMVAEGSPSYPFAVSLFPVLVFNLAAPSKAFEHHVERTRHLPSFIALGLCDHRVADLLDYGHHLTFRIVFEPTGFYRLFHLSPLELLNYAHDGRDVLDADIAGLGARLQAARTHAERVQAVEEVLLRKVDAALPASGLQVAAVRLIQSRGRADLATLADSLGFSDSSWRRNFTRQIGVGPKRYARMLRFHHAVALKRDIPDLSWTDVCQEVGYYDQSHFIAEFHELGGATPSRFLAEVAAMPLALSRSFFRPVTEIYNRTR